MPSTGMHPPGRMSDHAQTQVIAVSDANAAMPYPDLGWGEVTAEEVQKVALTTFAYEFGEVVSTKQLLQRLRGQD